MNASLDRFSRPLPGEVHRDEINYLVTATVLMAVQAYDAEHAKELFRREVSASEFQLTDKNETEVEEDR